MPKLLRITTVPISLHLLLQGQYRYMVNMGFDVTTMSADGKEVAHVLQEGARHVIIPFTRKITPFLDAYCLWRLVMEIRKLRPDIIHTHTPKAGLLGMLAAWICGVPVRLHTVAGLPLMEEKGIKRFILEVTEKITYACAHAVYPNSEGLKNFLLHTLRAPARKLKVIGKGSSNGIDTVFFRRSADLEIKADQLRRDHNVGADDIVFSFVGRIVRSKGIEELVKAFKIVSREGTVIKKRNLFLLLIGDFEQDLDPLSVDVMKFLNENSFVILAGFQRDVRPWMMASDVFVFPSYREGFPNVVMQASLLGLPCIVSNINGCNEIVKHNDTGMIVPLKDIDALTAAMIRMAMDDAKRKSYGAAAKDFVFANFKRELIWEELRKEYEQFLALNR